MSDLASQTVSQAPESVPEILVFAQNLAHVPAVSIIGNSWRNRGFYQRTVFLIPWRKPWNMPGKKESRRYML